MRDKLSSSGRRSLIALVAIGATALAASLPAAIGHKQGYDSNLQLKIDELSATTSQFSGMITSNKGACESGRPVTVTANGVTIATATSVPGGAWSATGPAQVKGTTVIAAIPRKILKRSKKHKHKCTAESAQRQANPGKP